MWHTPTIKACLVADRTEGIRRRLDLDRKIYSWRNGKCGNALGRGRDREGSLVERRDPMCEDIEQQLLTDGIWQHGSHAIRVRIGMCKASWVLQDIQTETNKPPEQITWNVTIGGPYA